MEERKVVMQRFKKDKRIIWNGKKFNKNARSVTIDDTWEYNNEFTDSIIKSISAFKNQNSGDKKSNLFASQSEKVLKDFDVIRLKVERKSINNIKTNSLKQMKVRII